MRKTFIIGLVISQTVAAQNISQRLEDETKNDKVRKYAGS